MHRAVVYSSCAKNWSLDGYGRVTIKGVVNKWRSEQICGFLCASVVDDWLHPARYEFHPDCNPSSGSTHHPDPVFRLARRYHIIVTIATVQHRLRTPIIHHTPLAVTFLYKHVLFNITLLCEPISPSLSPLSRQQNSPWIH